MAFYIYLGARVSKVLHLQFYSFHVRVLWMKLLSHGTFQCIDGDRQLTRAGATPESSHHENS